MDLETVRQERGVVGFRFPDGAEMEVWRPEDEFQGLFGAGPVVGLHVDGVGAARARIEAAGVEFIGPVQRSGALRGATSAGRTGTSTRSSRRPDHPRRLGPQARGAEITESKDA
jgi:hypothetical protein